jgi:MerR family transcriptional regulator, light-induced transcriptional regulator
MNDRSRNVSISLSIAAVERDTGLSKDTLRVWERRYGFPMPDRDAIGERAYAIDQVERLRLIKRLMDAGHRPGRVVPLPLAELQLLSDQIADPAPRGRQSVRLVDLRGHLDLVRRHDARALRAELTRQMVALGLGRFVTEVLAPLNTAIGDAWIRGQLEIFEEHLYTEAAQVVLRQGLATLPPLADGGPEVLLTTFPGEPHGLGLLMAEAILAVEGCRCTSLGVQTPLWDIVLAARAHAVDVVALSFTGCMSPNQVVDGLTELRSKLPAAVQVWAGGSAPVLHRRRVDGVLPVASLDDLLPEVERWRAATVATRA